MMASSMTSPSVKTGGSLSLVHGGIRLRRATGSVVGRATELALIEEAIDATHRGIAGLCIEGEPGIGKSRLLLAAAEIAGAHGFAAVGASADEEFRGPFLVARSIFGSEALREDASPRALQAIDRARDVLAGRDDAGLDGLPPDQRSMRVLDQVSLALHVVASERPVALLLDDLQWADADSLRLLRYVVRTDPAIPVFFMFAIRPEESADVPELVTLLADMERMGIVRRLRLGRFKQPETIELLRLTLAGPVEPGAAATIQAQGEGVPFVIEELARSYRENGLLQQIDGTWRLSPKAGKILPSSVRTLIQRRAAHLPEPTRLLLADAAVIGRSFRAADVCAVRAELGEQDCSPAQVSEILAPAVAAGLLSRGGDAVGDEFSFTHAGVADFAEGLLSVQRRRAIHGAIVDLLTGDDEPSPAFLPALARHALAAGDLQRSSKFCVLAASAAIAVNAPEEALRVIDEALTAAARHQERVALLRARDDALEMLRRTGDRLEGLAELAALAEASGDTSLEREIRLRRAAALRLDEQYDQAAELARGVRQAAAEGGDRPRELAACLELGQDLLGVSLGEGFILTTKDADLDGAEEAFSRAAELAAERSDDASLAAAERELGLVGASRLRAWFVEQIRAGNHVSILQAIADGERLQDLLASTPILPTFMEAAARLQRALELFERLGDRRGAMSTIIALAYLNWGPDIHVGANPALRIEEVRRLASRFRGLTRESDRAAADAQMLYGVHVFCRSKVIPDLAITRGRDAHAIARTLGDRLLEFLVAGGTALAYIDIGDFEEAERWLGRAAAVAADAPTPSRARQLEVWRASLAAATGDADRMRVHLGKALELAAREGRPAPRCETLALGALLAARLGADRGDASLMLLAAEWSDEVKRRAAELPGRPPWAAQADAALARVALAQGDVPRAVASSRTALEARHVAMREEPHLEILLPAARAILAGGEPLEQEAVRAELRLQAALIAQRTLDADVRARWFRASTGRELAELSGWVEKAPGVAPHSATAGGGLDAEGGHARSEVDDERLLQLLTEGQSDGEIAHELDMPEDEVVATLAVLYRRIGATSRTEATVYAVGRPVA